MGVAIAAEAARRGAEVTLVVGPTAIPLPAVAGVVRVRGAREMHRAVMAQASAMDVVIMAAAVADYAPAERQPHKVTKDAETLTLVLARTPDILKELGAARQKSGAGPVLVGFAAETEDVIARAKAKRQRKHVDLMIANDVSRSDAGFDVETNQVTLVDEDGADTLPLQTKTQAAGAILDRVEALLQRSTAKAPVS